MPVRKFPLSSFIPASLHFATSPSAGCLFHLPFFDRNYPSATAMHTDSASTHWQQASPSQYVMLHTPDRAGLLAPKCLVPLSSGCFQHYIELHTICRTYQLTNNTLHHRDCSLWLCMLLHHWRRQVKHPAGGFTWAAPLLSASQVLYFRPLSTCFTLYEAHFPGSVPFLHSQANYPVFSMLPCCTNRSQGCFQQLHYSATTHKVSTRPTCDQSVGLLPDFLPSRSGLKIE